MATSAINNTIRCRVHADDVLPSARKPARHRVDIVHSPRQPCVSRCGVLKKVRVGAACMAAVPVTHTQDPVEGSMKQEIAAARGYKTSVLVMYMGV